MLIFHGREKVLESSMVASYISVSALRGVYRSVTFRASLWKSPARSNQVWPFRFVTVTTRVSPSQCPFDQPIQLSTGASAGLSIFIDRTAPANSYAIMIACGDWIIWNGYGIYVDRGTPPR